MRYLLGFFGVFALPLSLIWDAIIAIVVTNIAFGWFDVQLAWLQTLFN